MEAAVLGDLAPPRNQRQASVSAGNRKRQQEIYQASTWQTHTDHHHQRKANADQYNARQSDRLRAQIQQWDRQLEQLQQGNIPWGEPPRS